LDFGEQEKKEKAKSDAELRKHGYKVRREGGGGLRWRGECYGLVDGVPVGTVFGAGDWQREGRKEMTDTGFHVPMVQPEFLEPNGGCYALILNNDNGSSRDEGETVWYAGSGGRHRGQNRTAKQSFHQDWSNTVNSALKLTCEKRLPVRVIRGPKLSSKFKPAEGGYRYDGLYNVEKAFMEVNSDRLKVCMFQLVRHQGQPPLPVTKKAK
jgi:E3 ubiquitin-protein ligase UHRF1